MAGNNIARVYAASLFDSAKEAGILDQIHDELNFVAALYKEEKDFRSYINSPSFSKDEKKEFVRKVFSADLSKDLVSFVQVLINSGRQMEIENISAVFDELTDELYNRMKVDVVSVSKLDEGTLGNIKSALKQKFGKDVIIREKTDASILGGIIIKAGDLVIDGSLAENLKKIRDNLLNSKVRSEVAYED